MNYFFLIFILLFIQQRPDQAEINQWSTKYSEWTKLEYYAGKDFIESMYFYSPSSISSLDDSLKQIKVMETPFSFIKRNLVRFINDSQKKYNFTVRPRYCVATYVVNCKEEKLNIKRIDFFNDSDSLLINIQNPSTNQIWSKIINNFGVGEKILLLLCE